MNYENLHTGKWPSRLSLGIAYDSSDRFVDPLDLPQFINTKNNLRTYLKERYEVNERNYNKKPTTPIHRTRARKPSETQPKDRLDSKKETGYVGLKNQKFTCYLKSLVQALYYTNEFRKTIYKMPIESDDSGQSLAFALQRVFHELQISDEPVDTVKLTKSLSRRIMVKPEDENDIHECLRAMIDQLSKESNENIIYNLFEGIKMIHTKCINVDYQTSTVEPFYDIQLKIEGNSNITESFNDLLKTQVLDGVNKFNAGKFGLQDAEQYHRFIKFPTVLHLFLMRFKYDPFYGSVKINDRFEFTEKVNIGQHLETPTPAEYTLHSVVVHIGNSYHGHYVVYINPKGDGQLISQRYLIQYGETIPCEQLVSWLCDIKQAYTQYGGKRPFGVSILYMGWDDHYGYQLYQSDPSGNYSGWKATCIGHNSGAAVSSLKTEYKEGEMTVKDALALGIKVLSKTLDTARMTPDRMEVATLQRIDGKCVTWILPEAEVQTLIDAFEKSEAEAAAQKKEKQPPKP